MAVPEELVDAALRAAAELGRGVADVPAEVIARHAGMSRSTLLRRLGGSRSVLDEAVRARGTDPGGLPPVRVRAVGAAAELIGEIGLGAVTLEAIADRAECSVPSLHAVFGTRDGLLREVFEQYSPVRDVEAFLSQRHGDLRDTVRAFYGMLTRALDRPPRVVPAIFAEALARPHSPAVQAVVGHGAPRMLGLLAEWLTGEVAAGRVRDLPVLLLAQQLMAPMLMHLFVRPAGANLAFVDLPDIDSVCDVFADAFVRAVTTGESERR